MMYPQVTFATTCWERDWKMILQDPDYLKLWQIQRHQFPFCETLLIINNVTDPDVVRFYAQKKVEEGVLSRFVFARDLFSFFDLDRSEFNDWQYYNAIAPLTAIFEAKGEYLLYTTGDVYLKKTCFLDW